MNHRIHLFILVLILATAVAANRALAQEEELLICSECQIENAIDNKFCLSCGTSLADEYAQFKAGQQNHQRRVRRFISERVDPPRLFTVPTARVLGSMDIRLVGGGAFGVATDKSFLGTVGIGLGNIAEVEFSTVGMVNNISRGSTVFPTSAFKLQLIPENRWNIPLLTVAFRSSSNWQDVRSDEKVLAAEVDFLRAMVSNVGYDTRFTTMYGITTWKLWALSLHAGVSLTDVRVKELAVGYSYGDSYYDPVEQQKNLTGGFFGFDIESNPQTKLMFEVLTVSNYQYNVETKNIDVSEAYLGIGGVRFFFSRWLSTDVGVWYQSTFKGIADLQIKLGLNLFIPGGNLGRLSLKKLPTSRT